MPLVKIWVGPGRSVAEKRELLEAVHRSIVEGLGVPEDDRTQILLEHAGAENPTGMSDGFTLVEIFMRPGRSGDMKQRLYREIKAKLDAIGTRPSDVLIAVHEVDLQNWGFPGE